MDEQTLKISELLISSKDADSKAEGVAAFDAPFSDE